MINLLDFQSGRFCKINHFSLKINPPETSQNILSVKPCFFI